MAWFRKHQHDFPAPYKFAARRRTRRGFWCSATRITRRTPCVTGIDILKPSGGYCEALMSADELKGFPGWQDADMGDAAERLGEARYLDADAIRAASI